MSDALADFGQTVEELFKLLSDRQSSLGSDIARVFGVLSKHIEFREEEGDKSDDK